jgi:hypothetical protein
MNASNFKSEWGNPDTLNFAVQAEEYAGDLFLSICKPRREMCEEVVVHSANRDSLRQYLWDSLRVVAANLGFTLPEEPIEP